MVYPSVKWDGAHVSTQEAQGSGTSQGTVTQATVISLPAFSAKLLDSKNHSVGLWTPNLLQLPARWLPELWGTGRRLWELPVPLPSSCMSGMVDVLAQPQPGTAAVLLPTGALLCRGACLQLLSPFKAPPLLCSALLWCLPLFRALGTDSGATPPSPTSSLAVGDQMCFASLRPQCSAQGRCPGTCLLNA